MIKNINDLRQGFSLKCDVVVIGSGPGGAMAALNLAEAGFKVAVIESGAEAKREDMTRDAPKFMAKYFWEAGLRVMGGTTFNPSMHAKVLGGGSVVNSAIMYRLPDWVKTIWQEEDGLDFLFGKHLDDAYKRVFKRMGVTATPKSSYGLKNQVAHAVMKNMGLEPKPLPRSVIDCHGCGDCLTGCSSGSKQSVDHACLKDAMRFGAEVYTCSHVKKIITKGTKVTGVKGVVLDPDTHQVQGKFHIEAPLVMVAAGAPGTPVVLKKSRITAGKTVGATLSAHLGAWGVGIMNEPTDPWVGASQGVGCFDNQVQGVKFESLWAPESVIALKWGGVGHSNYDELTTINRVSVIAAVYRGNVSGKVGIRADGNPNMKLNIPRTEINKIMKLTHRITEGYLKEGAEFVFTGIHGVKEKIRNMKDAEDLLNPKLDARSYSATMNHVSSSCIMGRDEKRTSVDLTGKVRGVDGLYICDASIFPSSPAVNPQATVMALSDLISRRLGGFKDSDYLS